MEEEYKSWSFLLRSFPQYLCTYTLLITLLPNNLSPHCSSSVTAKYTQQTKSCVWFLDNADSKEKDSELNLRRSNLHCSFRGQGSTLCVRQSKRCTFPRHAGVGNSRGIAPLILNLDSWWRWVVNFTPWPLYTGKINPTNTKIGTVVWITALHAGRSRVRFPMVSLKFFIDIILPVSLRSWGWLSF
jgi:hypothetical protein